MRLALVLSTVALLAQPLVQAASSLAYCATENTGSSYSAVTDTYQSNGACEGTCADYALGVLQGKKCWCSNVAPAEDTRKNTTDCSTGCPGYPSDSCGSAAKGVWAYVKISGNSVTSTASDGSTTSTTSGSSSSTTSSSSTSTKAQTSSSDTTTAGKIVKETTSAGQVKTITVSAASATGQDLSADSASSDSSKLSGGSIAGIVIGVIGGLALVGALIFMIFFYRKRARAASPIPSNADMAENRTSRGSSFPGVFPQGNDQSGSSSLGRKHTFTDNRLKTDIYPNGRRDSSVSLQDNEDYSRPVLRLTNPD